MANDRTQGSPDDRDRDRSSQRDRTIGEGMDSPDSTQMPLKASTGEPDWETQSDRGRQGARSGERARSSGSDRSASGSDRGGADPDRDREGMRASGRPSDRSRSASSDAGSSRPDSMDAGSSRGRDEGSSER
jgi:hypothetical protein